MKDDSLLMFVGRTFYPTKENFINEAAMYGCSKRVAKFPKNIKLGETKVFVAMETDEYVVVPGGIKFNAKIFGFFVASSFEQIVEGGNLEVIEGLQKLGIHPVDIKDAEQEPERGCGFRPLDAKYIVGRDALGVLSGPFVKLNPAVESPLPLFRGYRYIDGDLIVHT